MLRNNPLHDRVLIQKVNQHLSSRGMRAPCKVAVTIQNGMVTISGKIQYEHQRQLALRSAGAVEGVGRIVDQLQVIPREAPPKNQNQR
ncbi:MAG: BON domain-containing protein [Thermoguttaceae bacterium]|jgi:osmotically-inducible protein OsmY